MRVLATTLTSRWLIAAMAGLAAMLTLAPDTKVGAQSGVESAPGTMHPLIAVQQGDDLIAIHQDQFTYVAAPAAMESLNFTSNVTASFVVNYSGFTPQAQAAFQRAVDIWSNIVVSPVPIVINANWTSLPAGVLGSAGPTFIYRDFQGAPEPNTWYISAIANALTGVDLAPGPTQNDITANFSSAFPNWYFGTDGNTPAGQFDFVSVVLHEIGHGLGFVGTAQVIATFGLWGAGNPPFPLSYDRRIVNGSGQQIVNTMLFPNPSPALLAQFQSNNLFWNGAAGMAANAGVRPRIYAPSTFAQGSSYSHFDEIEYPAGHPNSLMTPAIGTAEAIHNPGAVARGALADVGWRIASPCTYSINPTSAGVAAGGVTGSTVAVTTQTGCAWTAVSNAGFVTVTGGASGTGSGNVTYDVAANGAAFRSGTVTIAGQTFTVNQNGTGPTMSFDRSLVNFGAVSSGGAFSSKTPGQPLRLTQAGAGTVNWTATPSHPWVSISAGAGTGSAVLTVDVVPHASLPATGAVNGSVTFAFTGAGNAPGPIAVSLNLIAPGTSANPTGNIDTPVDGATGVTGAVGFTGWDIDDVGILKTTLCRNPVAPETAPVDARCGGAAQIYIGDAYAVEGARPDVAAAFPTFPQNTRAGFGLMVLTNMLPNQGNGTYVFSVYMHDFDGHVVLLGNRTITCANSTATLPFGTIDTPDQGGLVSGTFFNFGWVLTPQPKLIPFDGLTITVFVDGVAIGNPTYNQFRADIAALFPGLQNSNGAGGALAINTTTLVNGVHTIAWSVTDNMGAAAGIGSRFFTVSNSGSVPAEPEVPVSAVWHVDEGGADVPPAAPFIPLDAQTVNSLPLVRGLVNGRRGWDLDGTFDAVPATRAGRLVLRGDELDRFELRLSEAGKGGYTGFLRVGDALSPLPIGSHLDPISGVFSWTPGVGFIGSYDLVFVRWSGGRPVGRREVRVLLSPKIR